MKTQPNKSLIIIIGILLIANIATLSFFLINKPGHEKETRPDKKAMVLDFLQKKVGFTSDQLSKYETIAATHHSKVKMLLEELSSRKEVILKDLATKDFGDSATANAAGIFATQQKAIEIIMFNHIRDIRSICTPAQLPVFDTGFYKIIVKRSNSKNEKKK